MTAVPVIRPGFASRWRSLEAWVGTPASAVVLFVAALAVYALQSLVLPAYPGRDMVRYVQTYVQYWYSDPVLPSVLNTRGPLTSLGVALPLELGGAAAEVWLALLYAASIVAWGYVALTFGPRAALATSVLLLVYPGYGILFHGLASDALFAAAFAGWAVILRWSILRPSVASFLSLGAGMGGLVLVRPSNHALIFFALLPLLLRAPWGRRLAWTAGFFVSAVAVVQSWYALAYLRHGDGVALRPSTAALVVAILLVPLLLPAPWPRRLALLAIPLLVAVVAVRGVGAESPGQLARSAVHAPSTDVFLFRAFQMDRIVSPDNGPASRKMGRVVRRELLANEPYRSYGIDTEVFFSSGSDRIFADLQSLAGAVDLRAVTHEAIREHPWAFTKGIVSTIWQLVWSRRVYAPEIAVSGGEEQSRPASQGEDDGDFIVVDGRRLPVPSEGQPIPASRTGPNIWTLRGGAREVWLSATERRLVFDDPSDERRYREFERDSGRLVDRIPTRNARQGVVHRLNQASRAYPPPAVWLAVGALGLAIRRPRRALVAMAPTAAALVVIVSIGLVAVAAPEYSAPVSPAFLLLAGAGLFGADPRGRLPWRRA